MTRNNHHLMKNTNDYKKNKMIIKFQLIDSANYEGCERVIVSYIINIITTFAK